VGFLEVFVRRPVFTTMVIATLVVVTFIFNLVRNQEVPELLLPAPKHTASS